MWRVAQRELHVSQPDGGRRVLQRTFLGPKYRGGQPRHRGSVVDVATQRATIRAESNSSRPGEGFGRPERWSFANFTRLGGGRRFYRPFLVRPRLLDALVLPAIGRVKL